MSRKSNINKQSIHTRTIETEMLMQKMRMFCINPNPDMYKQICRSHKIRNSTEFDIWNCAVLYTYGGYWNADSPDTINTDKADEFPDIYNDIGARLQTVPTISILNKAWYIFFATGDCEILEYIYMVCGFANKIQTYASNLFNQYRSEYESELLSVNHWSEHPLKKHKWQFPIRNAFISLDKSILQHINNRKNREEVAPETITTSKKIQLDNLFDDVSRRVSRI